MTTADIPALTAEQLTAIRKRTENGLAYRSYWYDSPRYSGAVFAGVSSALTVLHDDVPDLLDALTAAREELVEANRYGHEMAGKVVDLCRDMGKVVAELEQVRQQLAEGSNAWKRHTAELSRLREQLTRLAVELADAHAAAYLRAQAAAVPAAPVPAPADAPPCSTCDGSGWIRQEGQIGVPGSGCTHGCPDCPVGRERLARGELRDEDDEDDPDICATCRHAECDGEHPDAAPAAVAVESEQAERCGQWRQLTPTFLPFVCKQPAGHSDEHNPGLLGLRWPNEPDAAPVVVEPADVQQDGA